MHSLFEKQRYIHRERLLITLSLDTVCSDQTIVHFYKLLSTYCLHREMHKSLPYHISMDTYRNHIITLHFNSQVSGVLLQFGKTKLPLLLATPTRSIYGDEPPSCRCSRGASHPTTTRWRKQRSTPWCLGCSRHHGVPRPLQQRRRRRRDPGTPKEARGAARGEPGRPQEAGARSMTMGFLGRNPSQHPPRRERRRGCRAAQRPVRGRRRRQQGGGAEGFWRGWGEGSRVPGGGPPRPATPLPHSPASYTLDY